MKMSTPSCFPGRYSPNYRGPEQMRRCMANPSSRFLEDASLMCNSWSPRHNGDIFSGLNDGILSRAEALAAVDIGKHQNNHPQMATQLKHDVMYHHGMGAPPQRPLQGYRSVPRMPLVTAPFATQKVRFTLFLGLLLYDPGARVCSVISMGDDDAASRTVTTSQFSRGPPGGGVRHVPDTCLRCLRWRCLSVHRFFTATASQAV
uniref:Uncharacterized protein n=1 Tax=Anopheles atroparvus TaxID=41427 RepID=A0A182IRV8_ANOAO